ncbi:catechol 2,3-dioxygenase-like lactoylglutathione lyase family enzyme [Sphingomonas zeicaulis]|uniref:VOC family protein n=1 Tax=Sphingomonas zeicaulis TaxID=1632740 RepID=UPI003D24ADD1
MEFGGDLHQIGVVVRDIEEGMRRYRDLLGLGPFWRLDTDYRGRYRDWHGRFANRNAFTRWGALYLEMIEPVTGEGNAKEWLNTRGEGIFHLGYAVDDLSQRPQGVECVFESWGATMPDGSPAVIHLDTVDQLGYFVELSDRALVERLNAGIDMLLAQGGA